MSVDRHKVFLFLLAWLHFMHSCLCVALLDYVCWEIRISILYKYLKSLHNFWNIRKTSYCIYWSIFTDSCSIVQFSSVAQSCPTLWDPINQSMPYLPVHHQLPEFTQTHIHRVSDAIQPSHPQSSPSPPVPNPSQHQSLFQWVNSSHQVAKVLELQL